MGLNVMASLATRVRYRYGTGTAPGIGLAQGAENAAINLAAGGSSRKLAGILYTERKITCSIFELELDCRASPRPTQFLR